MFDEHLHRFGTRCESFLLDEAGEPFANFVIPRPDRFEDHASGFDLFVELGAAIEVFLFVAEHQKRGWRGGCRVEGEGFDAAQLLGFPHDHDLSVSHHRHLAAEVYDRSRIAVFAVENGSIESLFRLAEHLFGQYVGEHVDEIRLFAHQQVDGCIAPFGKIGADAFEGRYAVAEFDRALGHQIISRVIFRMFSVLSVILKRSSSRRPTSQTISP